MMIVLFYNEYLFEKNIKIGIIKKNQKKNDNCEIDI